MIRRPPRSTLFPYTRSSDLGPHRRSRKGIAREVDPANGPHKESAPDLGAPGPPLEERARVLLRYAVYRRRIRARIWSGGVLEDSPEERELLDARSEAWNQAELELPRHRRCGPQG